MKVTLDLADLVAKGQLTKDEADKLAKLGSADTGALGSNILLAFGTVAVALGGGFLFPTAQSVIVMGVILFVLGLALILNKAAKWALFAQFCVTLGALGIVGGVSYLSDGNMLVSAGAVVGLAVAAMVAQSGLLAALTILELTLVLGAGTAYWHASYFFGADRPAVTIAVLAVVTLALFFVSLRLPSAYERVCIIGARTAILLINLVFLIGSLFGDSTFADRGLTISAGTFTIVWALLLLGVGIWGVYANRRWVVNAAAVFGAIHFYTQWFEYLGPNPLAILGGGILLVVFGLLLRWINGRIYKPADPAPVAA
jgi:iron complex transport system permease protein